MATEKRLIYLEDAIAKIVDTPSAIAERLAKCEYGYYQNPDMLVDRQHEIIDLLMDVPTVEVVHGRWIFPTKINGRTFDIPHCSVCNGVPPGVNEHTKYCAHCGAKMDGDGNGT